MRFTRIARVLLPFVVSVILVFIYLCIISYWYVDVSSKTFYIKTFAALGVSIATLTAVLIIRGYIDISIYITSYGIITTGIFSYISYFDITHNTSMHNEAAITIAILLVFSIILPELYNRHVLKRMAEWCLGGKRLEDYSKFPWSFLNEKKKRMLSVLYFDVHDMGKIAENMDVNDLKKIINHILGESLKINSEHDGMLVRHTEDSILIAFEPSKAHTKFDSPEAFTAYQSVLCGIALKQMIEKMKQHFHIDEVKRLEGRVLISTDMGVLLQDIRHGAMDLSLFTNAMYTIESMLQLSDGTDLIIDSKTYELCSEYFITKSVGAKAYSVLGLSGYST